MKTAWLSRIAFFLLILGMPLWMDIRISSTFGVSKTTFLRFLSILIAGIWVIRLSNQPFKFIKTPIFIPIVFFSFIFLLSTIFSRSPVLSFFGSYERQEGFLTAINYIFLFFALVNLLERDDVKLVMNAAVLGGFLASLYGIMQHYNYDPFNLSWGEFSKNRVVSTFGNPVFFGAYTIMALPLAFSLFILTKRAYFAFLYGAAFFTIFLGFLFANTRACYVGLFLEVIFGGIALFMLRDKIPKKRVLIFVAIFLIPGILVNLKKETSVIPRLVEIIKVKEKKFEGSAGARLMMWKTGIKMIKDNPILGIGPEAIGITYPYYLYKTYTHDFPFEYEDRMHNDIFDTSVTRGLLGLFSYIFLLFSFFILIIRVFFKSGYEERIIILGLFLSVLGYLIQNEFSFGLSSISTLFWLLMASPFLLIKQKLKIKPKKRYKLLFLLIPISSLFIPLFSFYYADLAFRNNNYERAIKLNPFCHQYRESYGTYLVEMGKNYGSPWPDKIISEMSKACRIFKNDGILLSILGMGYEMKQEIDNAQKIYEKAIKINPYLGNTYNNLGAIYGNKGMFKEAGDVFLAGLYGFPWDSILFGNAKKLGFIMLSQGMIPNCEDIFERLTRIYKNKNELISLHREVSLRYLEKGRKDLAIKHLREILKLSKDDIDAKRMLKIIGQDKTGIQK